MVRKDWQRDGEGAVGWRRCRVSCWGRRMSGFGWGCGRMFGLSLFRGGGMVVRDDDESVMRACTSKWMERVGQNAPQLFTNDPLLINPTSVYGIIPTITTRHQRNPQCPPILSAQLIKLPTKLNTSLLLTAQISSGTNQIVAPIFLAIEIPSFAFAYLSSSVFPAVTRS